MLPRWPTSCWQRLCLPVQETQETHVWSLGKEGPLEEEMATHSSILAWKIPWTEEPGRLQAMGSQGVKHNWETNQQQVTQMQREEPKCMEREPESQPGFACPPAPSEELGEWAK